MIPKIRLKFKGNEYNLEFSSRSIVEMERRGFKAYEIPEKAFSLLPDMFTGAFVANHPDTPQSVIDEIYTLIDDKAELLGVLAEMLTLAIDEYITELKKARNGLEWEKI